MFGRELLERLEEAGGTAYRWEFADWHHSTGIALRRLIKQGLIERVEEGALRGAYRRTDVTLARLPGFLDLVPLPG